MTSPGARRRDGTGTGPVQAVVKLFLGQLLAVVAIAALITVVVTWLDPDDSDLVVDGPGPSPGVTAAAPSASSPAATATPSSPAVTTPPPTASPSPSPRPERKRPRVDVLNQSAPTGTGALTAQRLRAEGWRIGRVDDFSGNVSTTTVYWLDRDDRKAARRLAEDLGGVRVQEGFSTLVEGRLSVVIVEAL